MQITLATNKDIETLFSIWKKCFSADTVFLNFFFKECFPLTKTYVYKDLGRVVSSISLIDLTLVGNPSKKGAYLYGVCTLPEYRGNHLSTKLIEYAEDDCRENGYNFIVTRPASPSLFALYRKIGYTTPIYRQYSDVPLPIYADGVSFKELDAKRLKELRKSHLVSNYFEWDKKVLEYIIAYTKYQQGSAVELESERYIVGYPDEEDSELYHILEIGNNSPDSIKYPTLYLAGNLIKARHLQKTKVRIYFPINKHYSDLEKVEKEVYVLAKPLISELDKDLFFNFTME